MYDSGSVPRRAIFSPRETEGEMMKRMMVTMHDDPQQADPCNGRLLPSRLAPVAVAPSPEYQALNPQPSTLRGGPMANTQHSAQLADPVTGPVMVLPWYAAVCANVPDTLNP